MGLSKDQIANIPIIGGFKGSNEITRFGESHSNLNAHLREAWRVLFPNERICQANIVLISNNIDNFSVTNGEYRCIHICDEESAIKACSGKTSSFSNSIENGFWDKVHDLIKNKN
ncbi:hypothetical protein FPG78_00420 [Cardinium endosymbiont of Dermatophagoides farinae]|nr:hypothetical protein FPG78_00420 [Cardinium endosymbiont of Dermatophagoides farinae]